MIQILSQLTFVSVRGPCLVSLGHCYRLYLFWSKLNVRLRFESALILQSRVFSVRLLLLASQLFLLPLDVVLVERVKPLERGALSGQAILSFLGRERRTQGLLRKLSLHLVQEVLVGRLREGGLESALAVLILFTIQTALATSLMVVFIAAGKAFHHPGPFKLV